MKTSDMRVVIQRKQENFCCLVPQISWGDRLWEFFRFYACCMVRNDIPSNLSKLMWKRQAL